MGIPTIIYVLLDIARSTCPDITRSYLIFLVYQIENKEILRTMGVSHPVSRHSKIHFPEIPSETVAFPASWKRPAGPLYLLWILLSGRIRASQIYKLLQSVI